MAGRRPDIGPDRLKRMKQQIVASGPEGITQKSLREKLGIPRMSANRYCNRLVSSGEVKVIRVGRGAKYIAKSKIVMDPEIGAFVQGREAYYKILRKGPPVIFNLGRVNVDISKLTDLELGLLYFSSIMGALCTYGMLQAMSQKNPVLYREFNRKKPYYMGHIRKDKLVRQWIDGFISAIMMSAPLKFRELLYRNADLKPAKGPLLSIDAEMASEVHGAFANIYPYISATLDRISARLQEGVEVEKASLEAFEKSESLGLLGDLVKEKEKLRVRKKAKQAHAHSFKILKVEAGIKYYECTICHRRKSEKAASV